MTEIQIKEISKLAASSENTPELKSYWENRYIDLMQSGLFELSEKTQEIISSNNTIDRPTTPFGELVLPKLVTPNHAVDELSLQNTVETSIRLLDALLDSIRFTQPILDIVRQYRKIGLGIRGFKEYLSTKQSNSELEEIDYLGNLISNSSYRASESLAEEKGICTNWEKINKHLRPKSFEYWYNVETGEIKNGLEISEEMDKEQAIASLYEIIPRRNSSALLFPADLEWQIWSDRDDTAPKTEITPPVVSSQDIAEVVQTEMQNQAKVEEAKEENKNEMEISQAEKEIAQQEPEAIEQNQTEQAEIKTEDVNNFFEQNLVNTDEIPPENLIQQETNSDMNIHAEDLIEEKVEENIVESNSDIFPIQEGNDDNNQIAFEIGELVKVNNDNLAEFGKTYQVIDIRENSDQNQYRLTDSSSEQEIWMQEEDLSQVDLAEILQKINTTQQAVEIDQTEIQKQVEQIVAEKTAKIPTEAEIQSRIDKQVQKRVEKWQADFQKKVNDEVEKRMAEIPPPEPVATVDIQEQVNAEIQAKLPQEIAKQKEKWQSEQQALMQLKIDQIVQQKVSSLPKPEPTFDPTLLEQEVEKRVQARLSKELNSKNIQKEVDKKVEQEVSREIERKIMQRKISKMKIMSNGQS